MDAIDAIEPCSTTPVTATCTYGGYRSTCPVSCGFPSTCSFNVSVTWTGGYCCGIGETYFDCRCVGGRALCRNGGAGERMTPTTFCEFCERIDAGGEPEPDAGTGDAGTDDAGADDTGSDDAGSEDAG